MVFDSWAGELGPASFSRFSEPYLAHIAQKLPEKLKSMGLDAVPMTVFPKGAWHALDSACSLGYNVVGMDWLQDPAEAVKIRGSRNVVFQGNADPGVLYGTKEAITEAVEQMVKGFWVGNKGWIANLGHGEPPCQLNRPLATRMLIPCEQVSPPASTLTTSSISLRRFIV